MSLHAARLGAASACLGVRAAALSFFVEQAAFMIGGNSARLHGYPFWFFDSYFADLKGPGTYFDIGSFLADVAVWSLIVLVVAAAVAVLRRSVGTNAAQRVLRSSTR